ncbi:MAG: DUF11 domain-containing protein [Cellulomonadaceae bacterium]|nr:DUF11 domain-containing protein [Cellulomonadaceae bacterium]
MIAGFLSSFAIVDIPLALTSNPNTTGNIHITNSGLTGAASTGTYELSLVTAAPFGQVDLQTQKGWRQTLSWVANSNAYGVDAATFTTQLVSTRDTAADGTLTWNDIPQGVYYVFETADSDTRSLPFLVTIPAFDPTTDLWHWNVNANPKPAGAPTDVQITLSSARGVYDPRGFALVPLTIEVRNNGPERASMVKAVIELPDTFTEYQQRTTATDWPGKSDGSVTSWTRPITFGSIHLDVGDLAAATSAKFQVIGKIACPHNEQLLFVGDITHVLQNDYIVHNNHSTTDSSVYDHCHSGGGQPSPSSPAVQPSTKPSLPGVQPPQPGSGPSAQPSPQPVITEPSGGGQGAGVIQPGAPEPGTLEPGTIVPVQPGTDPTGANPNGLEQTSDPANPPARRRETLHETHRDQEGEATTTPGQSAADPTSNLANPGHSAASDPTNQANRGADPSDLISVHNPINSDVNPADAAAAEAANQAKANRGLLTLSGVELTSLIGSLLLAGGLIYGLWWRRNGRERRQGVEARKGDIARKSREVSNG